MENLGRGKFLNDHSRLPGYGQRMIYSFFRPRSPARSPAHCAPTGRRKRGFSLIEAAIVLGVVGVIIGGIWVAASTVIESYKVNQAINAYELFNRNTKRFFPFASFPVTGQASITSTVIAARLLPDDFISTGHPWGETWTAYIRSPDQIGELNLSFGMDNIPQGSCIKIVQFLLSKRPPNGDVAGIWTTGGPYAGGFFLYQSNIHSNFTLNSIKTLACPLDRQEVGAMYYAELAR